METKVETTLIDVEPDGDDYHLTLSDGSKWFVDPSDLPVAATWVPTAPIQVTEIKKSESQFSHQLTHVDANVSVRALKVE